MSELWSDLAEAAGVIAVGMTTAFIDFIEDHWPYAVSPKPPTRPPTPRDINSARAA